MAAKKSAEAQRKREQREANRAQRESDRSTARKERKPKASTKDDTLVDKAKRAATRIGESLGISSRDAATQRKKGSRERYADQVAETNQERQRRRDEKAKRADQIADKAGTRKPSQRSEGSEGEIDAGLPNEGEVPVESPPMFESDDVAALAGYPPEITEEQYENVVRKSALGF